MAIPSCADVRPATVRDSVHTVSVAMMAQEAVLTTTCDASKPKRGAKAAPTWATCCGEPASASRYEHGKVERSWTWRAEKAEEGEAEEVRDRVGVLEALAVLEGLGALEFVLEAERLLLDDLVRTTAKPPPPAVVRSEEAVSRPRRAGWATTHRATTRRETRVKARMGKRGEGRGADELWGHWPPMWVSRGQWPGKTPCVW